MIAYRLLCAHPGSSTFHDVCDLVFGENEAKAILPLQSNQQHASLMVLMRVFLSPLTELADGNPMYEVKMNVIWSPAEPRAVATELS